MKGKFVVPSKGDGHPPVLVLDFSKKIKDYHDLKKNLPKEMFLRVRRLHTRYSKLVINSISDVVIDENITLYSKCRINIPIEIGKITDEVKNKLDNSPVWIVAFVSGSEYIELAIEKGSEEVVRTKIQKYEETKL